MQLYVAEGAPSPRRVLMFAAEKGVLDQVELVPVSLMRRENTTEAFRKISPFGELPALRLPNGNCVTEAGAIIGYLDTLADEPPLLGRDAQERAVIAMWDRRLELRLFYPAALMVRETAPFFAAILEQSPERAERQRRRVMEACGWLNDRLADTEWIAADRLTVADITAVAGLDFAKLIKFRPGAEEFPHLARWREAMAARPSAAQGLPAR